MAAQLERVSIHKMPYEIDLLNKEFRRRDVPWVKIGFETRWGMRLCQRFGIVQCSECGSYSKVKEIKESAECSNCGLFFIPAEVIA